MMEKINNNDRIVHYVNPPDNQDYYVYYTETESKKLSHEELAGLLENFKLLFEFPIYKHCKLNISTMKLQSFGGMVGMISFFRPKFCLEIQKVEKK